MSLLYGSHVYTLRLLGSCSRSCRRLVGSNRHFSPVVVSLFSLAKDIVCPEGVKLDEIDSAAVSANFEKAKAAFGAAAAGSVEQAEAQIDMDVNRAMGLAIGISLS